MSVMGRRVRVRSRLVMGLAAAATVAVAGCGSAEGQAAEWTIRTNDWNPPAHPFNAAGWEPFAEAIEERTDGRVQVEHYPSEGLGAVTDTLIMLETGQADMASTVSAYHPDTLKLLQATAGMGWESAALGSQAMWELCQSEPFKSEFERNGVVPIFCVSVSSYELLTAGAQINEIPDAFEGLRIRATGLQGDIVEALGASATDDSSTEIYQRMEQGSIDGTTAGWYTLDALSLGEVTENITNGMQSWNAGMVPYLISADLWEEFPPDVKKAFIETGRELSLAVGEAVDEQDANARDAAEGNIEIHEVTDEEREEVAVAVEQVLQNWVTSMEAQGQGAEAQQAVDAVLATRDIEPLPVEQWAEFAY